MPKGSRITLADLADTRPNKAPIVKIDRSELGDKKLDDKESLIRLREENYQLTSHLRKPDQAIVSDEKMAQGSPMEWTRLLFLLAKLCPSLVIMDGGWPNSIQLRIPDARPEYLADGGTRYVTGFKKEVLPEHSWETLDEHSVPTEEIRGWRKVVGCLIRQQLVPYKEAVAMFGESYGGPRSSLWREALRDFRT